MNRRSMQLTFAACTLIAAPLFAKEGAMPAPAVPPEQAQLAIFDGHWHCTGTTFASPMGPEHKTTATVHGAKAVGGRWIQISYDEDKTAANPTPYHAGVYMGYDAGKKAFVESCFDNLGGHCNQTASGWNGDVLAFEGNAEGGEKAMAVRDTFTRKGPNELVHTGEMQGDDKKWMKLDEETCHKDK